MIDAIRVSEALNYAMNHWESLPDWMRDAYKAGTVFFGKKSVIIRTLEGTHEGNIGDWLIRAVNGEIYPCKPDIFAETYEPAESTSTADAVRPTTERVA